MLLDQFPQDFIPFGESDFCERKNRMESVDWKHEILGRLLLHLTGLS
jgi:hypothetical protein